MIGYRRANRRYVLLLLVLTAITLITLDSRREQPGALGAVGRAAPVSYTHLTLPTNREV